MFKIIATLRSNVPHLYCFKGSGSGEWSADLTQAELYPSEEAAHADLAGSSPVYVRYVAASRIVEV